MRNWLAIFTSILLGFGTLSAQPDGKVKKPFLFSVTTNPALFAVGHAGIAADWRMYPRHAVGLEYTAMGRALHQEISPDSIPDFFGSWIDARGSRFFLRYKVYPFFVRRKVRLSYFYLSAQVMYRQLEFPTVEISYFENTKTYTKEVREFRRGGRFDLAVGADIPIGRYLLLGGYAALGLGTEHIFQYNTQEYDLQGIIGPERQFFEDEPDFFRNLIGMRAGIVLGITLPSGGY